MMETTTHYGKHIVGGLAIGMLVGYLANEAQKVQKYKSPHGGSVYCVVANRIPAQPLHINGGTTISFTADVPVNYTDLGKLFSKTYFDLNTALATGATIGTICGTVTAYNTKT
ncbi:MAG: hypothetical protein KFB93_04510 [Simkaniaceae bacterium]|nr:MAG: hypothetical protein KFB93_04510 [Simkaniaceae bacterium]